MTADGGLHDVSVAIGRLEEGMRFLAKQVHTNQEVSTDEHRKVHDIVVAMSASVRMLSDAIAEMKPLVEDYREKRAEARGAARLIKIVYAMAGGSVAMALSKAVEYFAARPPHS